MMMTDERWNQLRACHNQWAWDCDEQGEVIAEMARLRAEVADLKVKLVEAALIDTEQEASNEG